MVRQAGKPFLQHRRSLGIGLIHQDDALVGPVLARVFQLSAFFLAIVLNSAKLVRPLRLGSFSTSYQVPAPPVRNASSPAGGGHNPCLPLDLIRYLKRNMKIDVGWRVEPRNRHRPGRIHT